MVVINRLLMSSGFLLLLGSCAIYPPPNTPPTLTQGQPVQILIKNEYPEHIQQEPPPPSIREEFEKVFPPVKPVEQKPIVVVNGCSYKFILPAQDGVPKFDLEALQKIDKSEHQKIQNALLDHIEKLHRFVHSEQKKNKEAYEKYRRNCK